MPSLQVKWAPYATLSQAENANSKPAMTGQSGYWLNSIYKLESSVPRYVKTKEHKKQSLVQNLLGRFLENKTNPKRALFKIIRIVVRFVALRVRVLCQEMYHRSTSQNISWDLQPLQHQKSTVTHWWQCLTSKRADVHDLLVKSLVTICRRWCSSPTNKWMTSLASAAIRNETLFHNLAWMQHSN